MNGRTSTMAHPKRSWPWYVAATTLAIVVLPVLPKPYSEAEVLVGAVGGIWALAFYLQSRHAEDARFLRDLLQPFGERYDKLNDELQKAVWDDKAFTAEQKLKFIDYFNLCAEEWLFWNAGYIYVEVWTSWENGMRQYGKHQRVKDLWQQERKSNSYYGFEFPSA